MLGIKLIHVSERGYMGEANDTCPDINILIILPGLWPYNVYVMAPLDIRCWPTIRLSHIYQQYRKYQTLHHFLSIFCFVIIKVLQLMEIDTHIITSSWFKFNVN